VLLLGWVIFWKRGGRYWIGGLFVWFVGGYLGWRFVVEFIKPRHVYFGAISAIQMACLVGLMECVRRLARGGVNIEHSTLNIEHRTEAATHE
jgi:hypothetical protein